MSSVAIITSKLIANGTLTAVVPVAQIVAGILSENTPLPAIAVTLVSSVERLTVSRAEPNPMHTDRVQVTVLAKTYPQLRQVLDLVRAALPTSRGPVTGLPGVRCDSINPELVGPDFSEADLTLHGGSRDFIVRWSTTS